jgi:signal transduction histidine kinase
MRERAQVIKAELEIKSKINVGTQISAKWKENAE